MFGVCACLRWSHVIYSVGSLFRQPLSHTGPKSYHPTNQQVGISDVAIHVPKAHLVKLMADACSRKALAEGLQNAYKRLRKHISDDSGLFLPLWDRIAALLVQRFARYEEMALGCYDVRLEPSANLVRQLAHECRSQGGK